MTLHSSGSCQANITLSDRRMWHSITVGGPVGACLFPFPSLKAISDIATLLLSNATYTYSLVCTYGFYIPEFPPTGTSVWLNLFG